MTSRMPHTPQSEAEEQQRNKHLQGDHSKGPQKVGHGVSNDEDGRAGEAPDDPAGGRQQGGERGR